MYSKEFHVFPKGPVSVKLILKRQDVVRFGTYVRDLN